MSLIQYMQNKHVLILCVMYVNRAPFTLKHSGGSKQSHKLLIKT